MCLARKMALTHFWAVLLPTFFIIFSIFFRKWAKPGLFWGYFCSFHMTSKAQIRLFMRRWYAWDLNPGQQDGRLWQNPLSYSGTPYYYTREGKSIQIESGRIFERRSLELGTTTLTTVSQTTLSIPKYLVVMVTFDRRGLKRYATSVTRCWNKK